MMAESPPSIPLRSNETPDPPTPNQQPELVRQQLRCRGLEPFRVGRVSSVYVVPDYLTVQEEQLLMSQVASAPITKWKNVTGRRLQNWGGVVHDKGLIAQPLTRTAQPTSPVSPFSLLACLQPWHSLRTKGWHSNTERGAKEQELPAKVLPSPAPTLTAEGMGRRKWGEQRQGSGALMAVAVA
ncbi:hypothetical protein CLOM_g207 [Closterium sp. NIES-68]|nr:hypothetical protein CLOM_g207 [Closterium sp. NIES-68]GJP68036.1 hypothetical protein CLOP_g24791 [Closterium sp. NIES-67]